MTPINSIEDFKKLQPKDKVYEIANGKKYPWRYIAENPLVEGVVLASDGDYTKMTCISKFSFRAGVYYVGEYNSKFIGEKLIEQLNSRIESTKDVYLKD
jgi:hypothetical protein